MLSIRLCTYKDKRSFDARPYEANRPTLVTDGNSEEGK